jgi:2,3-bisphosphoglycerate-independent phosphoglycerate mutase
MPVEIGIAKTLKADVLSIGSPSDFGAKAEKSLELLNEYGLVYVHLKGPDEPGHDGDYAAKKKVIEAIDQNFFGVLKNKLNLGETMLIVSSDHATPCVLKGHSDDPVPFILTSSDPKQEKICRFTERDCSRGSLGTIEGSTLLSLAKSLLAKK